MGMSLNRYSAESAQCELRKVRASEGSKEGKGAEKRG